MASTSVRRRERQREPRISCVGCSVNLLESSYAQIKKEKKESDDTVGSTADDCTHILCIECFGKAHADRSAGLRLKCPSASCDRSSRDWSIVRFDDGGHQPATKQKTTLPVRDEEDMIYHPTLYYSNQPHHIRREHTLLSISTMDPDNERKTNTYVAALKKDESETDDANVGMLERIGRTLHPFLLPTDNDIASKSHQTYPNPNSISSNQLDAQDESPLRRFIHGLATGKQFTEAKRRGKRERRLLFQKEFNVSYPTTETLRTTKGGGHRSSSLKNLVSDQLTASNVRDSVIKFSGLLGLSKNSNYITLPSDKAVEQKIREGWDPTGRGYGLIVGAYDNIGFRKLKGYVQYTLLSILFFNVVYLISIGVYPDPKLQLGWRMKLGIGLILSGMRVLTKEFVQAISKRLLIIV